MPAIRDIYAKFNQGISILEMLVILVIISGIVVMSIYYYSTATDLADFKEALNQFQSLANSLTSVVGPSNSATYPTTKWGGALTLGNSSGSAYLCSRLINFSDMKRDTCMRLFKALKAESLSGDWHLYMGNTCPVSGRGPVTWIYTYPSCNGFINGKAILNYSDVSPTLVYQLTP